MTSARIDALETVEWGEDVFGSLVTNRQFTRRKMLRLVNAGLVESIGMVVCDDDGFAPEPERHREGFRLTQAGRDALRQAREG